MKKFWVGLLSVLVLFGGFILVSCGTKKVSIELSDTYKEICLNSDLETVTTITAEVKGISNGTVTVSSSNTEVASVTSSYSRGKNLITVEGLSEGEAEIYVTSNYNSNVQRSISVVVYSEVKEMNQKESDSVDGKSGAFVIRNTDEDETEKLDLNQQVDNFIRFTPVNARKNITWSLPENFELDAEVVNNILTVGKDYAENTITLIATDITGVSTEVELAVINKLDENTIGMNYSHGGANERPLPDVVDGVEQPISIVPNISDDTQYTASVLLHFPSAEAVDITPVVTYGGVESDQLQVNRIAYDSATSTYRYEIKASNINVNKTFEVHFKIGYSKFKHEVSSAHFTVKCFERINKIEMNSVDGNNEVDAGSNEQDIYTNYSSAVGAFYKVRLLPTTVVDASRLYRITLDYSNARIGQEDADIGGETIRGDVIDENTVRIFYLPANGGQLTELRLQPNGNNVFQAISDISSEELYIKASDNNVKAFIKGVQMKLTSVDNENISKDITLNLFKAAGSLDFGEEDKTVKLATNVAGSITMPFVLNGQTSTEGLSVETTGEGFTVSNIKQTAFDTTAGTVRFEITFSVKDVGYTGVGKYKIKHKNGYTSKEYDIQMYLPLTDARVDYERTNSSILNSRTDGILYEVRDGALFESQEQTLSVSEMYIKTGATANLLLKTNEINGQAAQAQKTYSFYDFIESETMTLNAFLALTPNQIYQGLTEESEILNVTKQTESFTAKKDGYSYLVIAFTGLKQDGGEVTYVRIILIESYTVPSEMVASPQGVSVYASVSVSKTEDTEKTVRISFGNMPITYNDISNFDFISGLKKGNGTIEDGKASISGSTNNWTATWDDGNYMLSEINIQPTYMSFKITGLTTNGVQTIPDQLIIQYNSGKNDLRPAEFKDNHRPSVIVDVRVLNADRIESLEIQNIIPEKEGDDEVYQMYFDDDEVVPSVLVFSSKPDYARNKSLTYLVTDKNGTQSGFISVKDSNNGTIVKLEVNKGTIGYLYALPSDAIYNNVINYYVQVEEQGVTRYVLSTTPVNIYDLGKPCTQEGFEGTWYSYLKANAYFINNSQEAISFKDILVKVEVTVADGSSEELAYHIYTKEELSQIVPSKWYRLMQDVTLESWTSFNEFTGGLVGNNENVTINLTSGKTASQSFINVNKGTIKNLTFTGEISGNGFVANENQGLIDNVNVDVRIVREETGEIKVAPSVVNATGSYAGAIAGTNSGTIQNVRALGVTINGNVNGYVGGVVGKMDGIGALIKNAGFEIYTFESASGAAFNNDLEAAYVGGVIGFYESGSASNVYAYDYSIASGKSINFNGSYNGAIVGFVGQNQLLLDSSFAVVNIPVLFGYGNNIKATNVYTSYYSGTTYESTLWDNLGNSATTSGDTSGLKLTNIWIKNGQEGFQQSVNGGNPYLRDFHQSLPVSSVADYHVAENAPIKVNSLYKAINVSSSDSEEKLILFNYSVSDFNEQTMNNSEKYDLNNLNTISLAQLLGISQQEAESLVILSANTSVVDVNAKNLVVRRQGEVELTLSSKQDYTKSKKIIVKSLYALSDLNAARTYLGGSENILQDSTVNLQRGKNLNIVYTYSEPSVYLGNRGNNYELIFNETSFNSKMFEKDTGNEVDKVLSSDVTFTYTTQGLGKDDYKVVTKLNYVNLVNVTLQDEYLKAIEVVFTKKFNIHLFNGAIELGLSNGQVSITPSTMGEVKVTLKTNDENDDITPIVNIKTANGYERLVVTRTDDGIWSASYLGVPRLVIFRNEWTQEGKEGDAFVKKASYFISVDEDYRGQIATNQEYDIVLQSKLQVESESFKLLVSRQDFTNIDVTNYQVNRIAYMKLENNGSEYGTVYTVDESRPTSVISPGSTSILSVNINPDYAYYKYLQVEYSAKSNTVLSPLSIEYMTKRGSGSTGQYYLYRDKSVVIPIANGISVTPENKNVNNLYFKLWASNEVKDDTSVTISVKFFDGASATPIKTVNYFLTISYLSQPQILVNGNATAILAKGQSATVQVVVPYDQEVDIDSLTVENVETGITLYSGGTWAEDSTAGTKTYTTSLSASIRASLAQNANGMFAISVSVKRVMNGFEETKTTTAYVYLVDFKLDIDNISLSESEDDDTFIVYMGVARPLNFDYPLLPEDYQYDESNSESQEAMNKINEKRESFLAKKYFADPETRYFINYNKDSYNVANPDAGKITIDKQLEFQNTQTGQWHKIYNGERDYNTIGGRLEWSFDAARNIMYVKAKALSSDVIRMRLTTTMNIAGQSFTEPYEFNLKIRAYSDEDIPLLVENEQQFLEMAEGDEQNYILMNDITLHNYSPISTDKIASFDGNGFTINIENFNTSIEGEDLNLALFDNVTSNTTLKNIRVNLYQAGHITVNIAKFKNINIAGFALNNSGTITNCEVVSFAGDGSVATGNSGLIVTYIRGEGTPPISITGSVAGEGGTQSVTSTVAGFVGNNSGSITNSRVGGESIYTIGSANTDNGTILGFKRDKYMLEKFNLIAQGNVAGFVNTNAGAIASSFVKNIGISNDSDNSSYYTAGFAGLNSGKILTSYVEGVKEDRPVDTQCLQGSSIASKLGIIAGFVYDNGDSGQIKDAYSNILISNKAGEETVYLASGFVYGNKGLLENCFSSSQIENLRYSQMNFSGVNSVGELQTKGGKYVNCYYYSSRSGGQDNPIEVKYSTGATRLTKLDDPKYFYGFSFTDSTSKVEGIWARQDDRIVLVEPNNIALSNRYKLSDPSDAEKYSLPYSNLFDDLGNSITLAYGSAINPIIIRTAEEFVNVTGKSTSSFISSFFTASRIYGNYRLVKDIDFARLLVDEQKTADMPSTSKAFTGSFYGNGFTMSNLSITAANNPVAFGLFASLEDAVLINVDISVTLVDNTGAPFVGALAGYIKNSNVINVNITNNEDALIQGLNFVGGVAGMVYGDSKLKNITINDANIIATSIPHNGVEGDEGGENMIDANRNPVSTVTASRAKKLREYLIRSIGNDVITEISSAKHETLSGMVKNYSYAGGLFGYVDSFTTAHRGDEKFAYNNKLELDDYSIVKVRVLNTVNVRAQVAGGVAGFTGYNTHVKDAGLEIIDGIDSSISHITAVRFYAGGIVGQAYGSFAQVYSQYSETTQKNIENSHSTYYLTGGGERGSTNIFVVTNSAEDYSQKYIGGLIGYVGSGSLEIAYSKLNVTSLSAQYAGGLIGGVNTGKADSYYISNGKDDNIIANYYINEAYSTGDIRAREAAAGIFGQVNKDCRVRLVSVNAVNFISISKYDGTNSNYEADDFIKPVKVDGIDTTINSFDKINVYAFVGNFAFANKDTDISALADAVQFVQLYKQKGSDGETTSTSEPEVSVGFSKRYSAGINIELSEYPGIKPESEISAPEIANKVKTFIIPDISIIDDASVGHTFMYGSFLGTLLWSVDNWYHNTDEFFPGIKFSVAQETSIYLDVYNAAEVLAVMQNSPNTNVIVRGKKSENSEIYEDVDLRGILNSKDYWGRNSLGQGISGYYGTIQGISADMDNVPNVENIYTKDRGRPALILDTPLFSTVRPGFNAKNLTIRYMPSDNVQGTLFAKPEDENGNVDWNKVIFSGAFINKGFSGEGVGDISGLTFSIGNIDFNNPKETTIYLNGQNSDNDVGLIAPSIDSIGKLSDVMIEFFGTQGAKPAVRAYANNAGALAGTISQTSEKGDMKVEEIHIRDGRDNGGTFLTVSPVNLSVANVGGYFGKVSKGVSPTGGNTRNLKIQVENMKHWELANGTGGILNDKHSWIPETTYPEKITIMGAGAISNLNVGGYIGAVDQVDEITFKEIEEGSDNKLSNVDISTTLNVSDKINAGLVIGLLEGSSSVTVGKDRGQSAVISGRINSGDGNVTNANIGGIIGSNNSELRIYNISAALEVSGRDGTALGGSAEALNYNYTHNLNGNYQFTPFKATGTANVGGLVGNSTNKLIIKKNGEGAYATINENKEAISVQASQANVGSIVGNIEKTILTRNIGLADNAESDFEISGNFKSNAIIQVQGMKQPITEDTNHNVGGFVGRIKFNPASSEIVGGNPYIIKIDGMEEQSAFMGQIYAACGGRFGGIIGSVEGLAQISNGGYLGNNANFTLSNTVFGGAIKVYGYGEDANSNKLEDSPWGKDFFIGGSIGYFENLESSSAPAAVFNVSNNYNFGDVFVLYNEERNLLNSVTYGGLIGQMYTNLSNNDAIQQNYILTTYNNQRPNSSDTANAVFGTVSTSGLSNTNYYNHSVCLLTDDFGVDAGYSVNYKDSQSMTSGGYSAQTGLKQVYLVGGLELEGKSKGLAEWISSKVGELYDSNANEGSKLNPKTLTSIGVLSATEDNEEPNAPVFNGMFYYAVKANLVIDEENKIANEFNNIAIIGNGYTIDATKATYIIGLIDTMKGQAFVSGLNVLLDQNIDITQEVNSDGDKKYQYIGGLVGTMEKGIIYSVGLLGNMTIGGNGAYKIAPMIGFMKSGLISNSFTDVDLLYRAGIDKKANNTITNGVASAVANTGSTIAIIDRTYAVGSVSSYIDAFLDGFSTGSATIRSSYTTTNLVWKDHTSATTSSSSKISVFKNATVTNCYYDTHAMGSMSFGGGNGSKTTSELLSYQGTIATNNYLGQNWVNEVNFNYGYPTHPIGYLKASSFKAQERKVEANLNAGEYGVETNSYRRLTNEEVYAASKGVAGDKNLPVNYDSYYYTIPNAGIWNARLSSFTNATAGIAKITLRNDIDFSYNRNEDDQNTQIDLKTKLDFDGLTHRIYNFKGAGLFKQINVGNAKTDNKIINVDILNADITGSYILAGEIKNAFVSNITLSGDVVSTGTTTNVGALAGLVGNSNIYSVTSSAYIYIAKAQNVGGIVGKLESNVTVQRCVNNGPIYVTDASGNLNVGGVVGSIGADTSADASRKVNYSYNVGSVLAGYNNDNAVSSSIRAGGIAGFSMGDIDYCYNSGLIKSGNKKCSSVNYAGGIVGQTYGLVTNSINEGAVEALAKNAEYKYVLELDNSSGENVHGYLSGFGGERKTISKVKIYSVTNKNVYADGIGLNNATNYLTQTTDNTNSNANIVHNGAAFANNTIVNNDWNTNTAYKLDISGPEYPMENKSLNGAYSDAYAFGYGTWFKSEKEYAYENGVQKNIITTSRDNFNFPTSYYVKLDYKVYMQSSKFWGMDWDKEISRKIIDNYISNNAKTDTKSFEDLVRESIFEGEGKKNISQSIDEEIKNQIFQKTEGKKNNTVTIGGRDFVLSSDAEELLKIMNSAYVYEFEYTPSEEIMNLGDIRLYNFTISSTDTTIDNNIVNISVDGWKTSPSVDVGKYCKPTFKVLIYTIEKLNDWSSVSIELSYDIEEKATIDLTGVQYNKTFKEDGTVDSVEIELYKLAAEEPAPSTKPNNDDKRPISLMIEQLSGGFAVGYEAKRTQDSEEVINVYKLVINGKDYYVSYNNSRKSLIYYKNIFIIEKNETFNSEDLNIENISSKQVQLYYGLKLKVQFTQSDIVIKDNIGSKVENKNIHKEYNSEGSYTHSTKFDKNDSIEQDVLLGEQKDFSGVNLSAHDRYTSSLNKPIINQLGLPTITTNVTDRDNFLYYQNFNVVNTITLTDAEQEALIKLGELDILKYAKELEMPDVEEGEETTPIEVFKWTLLAEEIEIIENEISYKFKVTFDEETLKLYFTYVGTELSEEDLTEVQTVIENLLSEENYQYLSVENCTISVDFDKETVTEKLYSFTSDYLIEITGNEGAEIFADMTLRFNDQIVARFNGIWTLSVTTITIKGVECLVSLDAETGKITVSSNVEYKDDIKSIIDEILENWKLTYDSISLGIKIDELTSGDEVAAKYNDAELAVYKDGIWKETQSFTINGKTAIFSDGIWTFENVELSEIDELISELNKIVDYYKTMRLVVDVSTMLTDVKTAIFFNASSTVSAVATYSDENLEKAGEFSNGVGVEIDGLNLIYVIENCEDVDVNAIINKILSSPYYVQYIDLNQNVYDNSATDNYLIVDTEYTESANASEMQVGMKGKLSNVQGNNKAFKFEKFEEGKYRILVDVQSGLWSNVSVTNNGNITIVNYGSNQIGGYTSTYEIKQVDVTITSKDGKGYLKFKTEDLDKIEGTGNKEIENGEFKDEQGNDKRTMTSSFKPTNPDNNFTLSFTIYKTYIDNPLKTGLNVNTGEDGFDATNYFDNLTGYEITLGINGVFYLSSVDENGNLSYSKNPSYEGIPSTTFTYNQKGELISYKKNKVGIVEKTVHQSTQDNTIKDNVSIVNASVPYSYNREYTTANSYVETWAITYVVEYEPTEDGKSLSIKTSKTETILSHSYDASKTENERDEWMSTFVKLPVGEKAPKSLKEFFTRFSEGISLTWTETKPSIEASITETEKVRLDAETNIYSLSFGFNDFCSNEELYNSSKLKDVAIITLEEDKNTVKGNNTISAVLSWTKENHNQVWRLKCESGDYYEEKGNEDSKKPFVFDKDIISFDGQGWKVVGLNDNTSYESISKIFESEKYKEGITVFEDRLTKIDQQDGKDVWGYTRVSVTFYQSDFITPKSVDVSVVEQVKDSTNKSIRVYLDCDNTLEYTSELIADYVSNREQHNSQLHLPNNIVKDSKLKYPFDKTNSNNNLSIYYMDGNEINIKEIGYNESEETVEFNYKPEGLKGIIVKHNIKEVQDYKFKEGESPKLVEDEDTKSRQRKDERATEWKEKYGGIILTRNIYLGYTPAYIGFAGHISGNDYTLSYTSKYNTLFNLITEEDKDGVPVYIQNVNIVGQLSELLKPKGDNNFVASILSLDNSGIMKNINIFGNIRNVIFESTHQAIGIVYKNQGTLNNITNYASINGLNAQSKSAKSPMIVDGVSSTTKQINTLNKGVLIAGDGFRGSKATKNNPNNKYGTVGGDIYISGGNEGYVRSGKGGASGVGYDGDRGEEIYLENNTDIQKTAGENGGSSSGEKDGGKIYKLEKTENNYVYKEFVGHNTYFKKGEKGNSASLGNGGLAGWAFPSSKKDAIEIGLIIAAETAVGAAIGWKVGSIISAPFASVLFLAWMVPGIMAGSIGAGTLSGIAAGNISAFAVDQPTIYKGADFVNGSAGAGIENGKNSVSSIEETHRVGNRPVEFLLKLNNNNMFASACPQVNI